MIAAICCTLLLACCHIIVFCFNLDTHVPVYKIGPENSYFGFSVAQHMIGNEAWLLIGAPKGNSSQPDTIRTGALYNCPINTVAKFNGGSYSTSKDYLYKWCDRKQVEYSPSSAELSDRVPDSNLYYGNKTDQLLGSVVSSSGTSSSSVLVCAPNLLFERYAYMHGGCYLLNNDLTQKHEIHTCQALSPFARHNGYGQCQEGFSAVLREDLNILVTGAPGPKRWIGGVNAQEYKDFGGAGRFSMNGDEPLSVEKLIGSHAYFGYSVGVGRFGFLHENFTLNAEKSDVTVVAGSPRYNETGGVFFLPFSRTRDFISFDKLSLIDNHTKLTGTDSFASTFGYSIAVLDIDKNGYDDLIVGAPNYYDAIQSKLSGGAVFVYFSKGPVQPNADVFHPPHILTGPSSFGISIASVGDLNKDGYNDIAVGVPFDSQGGSVYIFMGASYSNFDNTPEQIIYGHELGYPPEGLSITTFGWSLSGGVDMDHNGYPDLLVGAFNSSTAFLLRSKPIIRAIAYVKPEMMSSIDKEKPPQNCFKGVGIKTCFFVDVFITLNETDTYRNVTMPSGFFNCQLEVLPDSGLGRRAWFPSNLGKGSNIHLKEWSCRPPSKETKDVRYTEELAISKSNRDWLNPIKMRFSIFLPLRKPDRPVERSQLINLDQYPVLDNKWSTVEFSVEFDNKCGPDRKCHSDLDLNCLLPGLSQDSNSSIFVKDDGKDGNIDLTLKILNKGERAYETLLFVSYQHGFVEKPQLINGLVKEGRHESGLVEYFIANPLLEFASLNFTIRFNVIKDSTGLRMPKDPLKFLIFSNTTSMDTKTTNNKCELLVKVVTRTELSLNGYTTPRNKQLLYGGRVLGESSMEFFEDIGPEVQHIYELKNEGPWPVNDISIHVNFPFEVNSSFPRGKWALYITDEPTILIANPAQTGLPIAKPCELDFKRDLINPLQLKAEMRRKKRSISSEKTESSLFKTLKNINVINSQPVYMRVKPKDVNVGGEQIRQVTIDCNDDSSLRTAKCVNIRCPVKFLANNGNATVTIVSRLWNSTFVEDYRDVQIVEIISRAKIVVLPGNIIEETDYDNNIAEAITEANPDSPTISEITPIPLWIIVVAVLGGVLALLLLTLLLWKCGFFKRKRHGDEVLYKAEVMKHDVDYD